MSYTVLKTSSVLEPEVYVCDDYAEAVELLEGVRIVMAGDDYRLIADSGDHLMYRSPTGHTWAFTIVERAALSDYWKPAEVAA
jgi:hypothetical protein